MTPARFQETWDALHNETPATRELTMLVMVLREQVRILSLTQSIMAREEIERLNYEFGQFLMSKEGGE